jgi:hypothetical protein
LNTSTVLAAPWYEPKPKDATLQINSKNDGLWLPKWVLKAGETLTAFIYQQVLEKGPFYGVTGV